LLLVSFPLAQVIWRILCCENGATKAHVANFVFVKYLFCFRFKFVCKNEFCKAEIVMDDPIKKIVSLVHVFLFDFIDAQISANCLYIIATKVFKDTIPEEKSDRLLLVPLAARFYL
jgi:hypothetical protein